MAARLCGAGLRNWCNNPAVHLRREASARGRRIADSNIEPSSLEVARFPLNALNSGSVSVSELRPKKISVPVKLGRIVRRSLWCVKNKCIQLVGGVFRGENQENSRVKPAVGNRRCRKAGPAVHLTGYVRHQLEPGGGGAEAASFA